MTSRFSFPRALVVLLVGACSWALVGCSGGGSEAGAQSSEVMMSGQYVVGEDGRLVQPETAASVPSLDPAALQFNETGAELAARHFLELLEYAWATGDTQPARDFSSETCTFCTSIADEISTLYSSSGWAFGLKYQVTQIIKIEQLPEVESPSTYAVLLNVHANPADRYEDGQLVTQAEVSEDLALWLRWTGTQWMIEGGASIDPTEAPQS